MRTVAPGIIVVIRMSLLSLLTRRLNAFRVVGPSFFIRNLPSLSAGSFKVHNGQHGRFDSPRTALYSTAATTRQDDSALSKSRPEFKAPSNSPDDSKPASASDLVWNKLGLLTELVETLRDEMQLAAPTPVQQLVIPELLKSPPESLAFLAATGSGKTLAYLVPLIQQLKQQELFDGYERRNQRPRLLIVAPTRELVKQIASVLKVLSHRCKFSSTAVTGGEDFGAQRKKLMKPIDVVVATPGRLLKHWNAQNLFLSNLQHVVLDECDTMMEQGFTAELQQILYPILYRKQASSEIDVKRDLKDTAPIVVLTSATMTRSVQKMIHDHDTSILAKRHHHKVVENEPPQQRSILLPRMKVIKAPGLHKAVPRLKQIFIDVGGSDKLSLLVDVLSSGGSGAAIAQNKMDANALNMVFCNTAASCQAVQFALAEARIESLAYHGELNSAARSENLDLFRQAGSDPLNESIPRVLVCTDLAARGLDVPQVDHVIMFDFPLNSLDYLHRSGRTARGLSNSRQGNGRVTALVSKRDRVLANAIEIAVQRGDPLDGLSSRKSDYLPGGRLGGSSSSGSKVSSGSRFSKVSSGSKSSRLTIGKSKSGSKSSKFTVSNSGSRSSSSRGTYGKSTTGTKGRRPAMALKKSTSRRSSGSKSVSLRKRP